MNWRDGFIAVDWGTTNRRAYAVSPGGDTVGEFEDDLGVLSVPEGGFDDCVSELRQRLGEKPLLLAGMVGSNKGWVEAPYVRAPATLTDLVAQLRWVQPDVAIVPGVCIDTDGAADVMRGEEVQILGAIAAGLIPEEALVCHPGTHAKWIAPQGDAIGPFRTMMTGELFSLLKKHSILADLLQSDVTPGPAFSAGVAHALEHDDLAGELFSIRARFLLGRAQKEDCASYASGLLIGADVRSGLAIRSIGPAVMIGRPELTVLYASAAEQAGRETRQIDGEDAFLAGAKAIAEQIG